MGWPLYAKHIPALMSAIGEYPIHFRELAKNKHKNPPPPTLNDCVVSSAWTTIKKRFKHIRKIKKLCVLRTLTKFLL